MVAIFTGAGTGFERGSGNVVGAAGFLGSAAQGRGGDNLFLNAANGNLLISRQDEFLVGRGPDVGINRTYNSLGNMSDDNGDNWRHSYDRRVFGLTGTVNTAGSTIKRVSGDGSEITYTHNGTVYFTTDGAGAYDTLKFDGTAWTWTDGDTQVREVYETRVYGLTGTLNAAGSTVRRRADDGAEVLYTWSATGYFSSEGHKLTHSGSTWTWTEGTTARTETYNSATPDWRLTFLKDTSNNSLTFTYRDNKLSKVTTANGESTRFTWSGNNITDIAVYGDSGTLLLTRTRYTYDASNRLSTVTVDKSPTDSSVADGKSYVTTYTYHSTTKRVATISQTDGSKVAFNYDGAGRVTSIAQTVTNGITRTTTIVYGLDYAEVTTAGQTTRIDHQNGLLKKITSPPITAGATAQTILFDYTLTDDLKEVTDRSGNKTYYIHDSNGNVLTATDRLGNVVTRAYGAQNQLLWETRTGVGQTPGDASLRARFVYDDANRLVATISAEGRVTRFNYDSYGQLVSTQTVTATAFDVGGLGSADVVPWTQVRDWYEGLADKSQVMLSEREYDARGNLDLEKAYGTATTVGGVSTSQGWSQTDYLYDQAGQLLSRAAVGLNTEYYVYDGLGRTIASTDLDGARTTIVFNDAVTTTTVSVGGGMTRTSVYNKAGELISTSETPAPVSENLKPDLSNPAQWNTGNLAVASATSIAGQPAYLYTVSQTGGGGALSSAGTVNAGETLTFEITLKADANTPLHYFGTYGSVAGWGANADSTAVVISGPGTVAQSTGSLWSISGLSTTQETRIRVTRTSSVSEQVYPHFYVGAINGAQVGDNVILSAPSVTRSTPQAPGPATRYLYDAQGRLRSTIEQTGAPGPNLAPDLTNSAQWSYSGGTRVSAGTLGGSPAWLYTVNTDGSPAATSSATTVHAGDELSFEITLKGSGSQTSQVLGLLGSATGWGDASQSSAEIISGPGTLTQYGGLWELAGVSTSTETRIRITRRFTTTETARAYFYVGDASAYAQAGDQVILAAPSLTITKGYAQHILYDNAGRMTAQVDHTGAVTEYHYDVNNRVMATTRYANKLSEPNLRLVANPNSGVAIGTIRPAGHNDDLWTWTSYDAEGRVTRAIDGGGSVTSYTYDASGQLIRTVSYATKLLPADLTTLRGNPAATTVGLPASSSADAITRAFYDKDGRAIGALDALGYLSEIVYDQAGRKVREIAYANPTGTTGDLRASGTFTQLRDSIATTGSDRSTRYVYDGQGLLRYTVDSLDQVVGYVYSDGSTAGTTHGQVRQTIAYGVKISASATYTIAGVESAIATALAGPGPLEPSRTSYAIYDAGGRLAYAIGAEGLVTSYTYNTLGQVIKTVSFATANLPASLPAKADMDNWAANNAANTSNRITRSYYNGYGDLVYVVDAEGYVSETTYDPLRRVSKTIRHDKAVVPTDSWTTSTVAGADKGNATTIATITQYDHLGRVEKVEDAIGTITLNAYSATGLLTATTVALGTADAVTTTFAYDATGRVKSRTYGHGTAAATTTAYEYDGLGNLEEVRIADGTTDEAVTTYTYDVLGRMLSATTSAGTTTYTYDAFGNARSIEDARDNSSFYYFDALGRVIKSIDPENYVSETKYTVFGEVAETTRRYVKETDAFNLVTPPNVADHPLDAVTRYEYDRLGRVTRTIDAGSYQTDTGYTVFGEIDSVTKAGATTSFEYDRLGQVKKTTDAATKSETYTYDAFGRRKSVTNKLLGVTTYTYNSRGLLIQESIGVSGVYGSTYGTQTTTIVNTFSYDRRGNLKESIEAFGATEARSTKYTYDALNRVASKTGMEVATGLAGTLATPTETYVYDRRGNVIETKFESVATGGARTLISRSFAYYDDLNRTVARINPLGAVVTYSYDENSNLISTRAWDTAVTLPTTPGGAVPTLAGTYRETTNAYDKLNRLTKSSTVLPFAGSGDLSNFVIERGPDNTPLTVETAKYDYDAHGNVIKTTDANGNSVIAYYDALGRKTAQVDQEGYLTTWSHDANGNVDTERRYVDAVGPADPLEPLDYEEEAPARVTEFEYDLLGRRTQEKRLGVVAWTVEEDGDLVAANGDAIISYTYNALGQVTSKEEANGDTTSYTYDNAGRLIVEVRAGFADFENMPVAPTVRYFYDRLDQLTSTRQGVFATDASDRITASSYTAGRLAASTDAAGNTRYYHYDIAGRVVAESYERTRSDGSKVNEAVVSAYDVAGNVITQSFMRFNGSAWVNSDALSAAYDATHLRYNIHGEVTGRGITAGMATAPVYQEFYDYDAAGRMWRTNAGDGALKFMVYDKVGNQTLTLTSTGGDLSDLTAATYADSIDTFGDTTLTGAVTSINVYDERGMVVATREPDRQLSTTGSTVTITRSRAYNAFGEVVSETDARNYTTTFAYNTMGRLTRTERPTVQITLENGTAIWVRPSDDNYYDISGRLIATRDANGSYATDGTASVGAAKAANTGNLTTRLLLAGTGHGGGEALVAKHFNADDTVFQTLYDKFGDARILRNEFYYFHEATQTDNSAETDELRDYDAMGRLVVRYGRIRLNGTGGNSTGADVRLIDHYSYDEFGQRLKHWLGQAGSTIDGIAAYVETTDYDTQGRVRTVVAMGGDTTSYSYEWSPTASTSGIDTFGGWVKGTTNAAGVSMSETQDFFGRTIAKTDFGGFVSSFTFDKGGRLTVHSVGGGSTTHSWLNSGLTGSTTTVSGSGFNSITSTYRYNENGNRVFEGQAGTVYSHYLPSGTISTNETLQNTTVEYDALGRMTQVTDKDSSDIVRITVTNSYDANGNIRRTQSSYPNLAYPQYGSIPRDAWYRYDNMNRMVLADGMLSGGVIVRGGLGTNIEYDLAGRRATATRTAGLSGMVEDPNYDVQNPEPELPTLPGGGVQQYVEVGYTGTQRERYAYSADGQLVGMYISEEGYTDTGSGTAVANGEMRPEVLRASTDHDALGRTALYKEYNADEAVTHHRYNIVYTVAGRITSESVSQLKIESGAGITYLTHTVNNYSAGGLLNWSTADTSRENDDSALNDTRDSYTYQWRDDASIAVHTHLSDASDTDKLWTSTYTNDALGRLARVHIDDGRDRTVSFASNAEGQILLRKERSEAAKNPEDQRLFVAGAEVGSLTNNGNGDPTKASYANNLDNMRNWTANQQSAPFRWNTTGGVTEGDFGPQGYDPINPYASGVQGTGGSTYTVRSGDTLAGIASLIWGDASLWYKLAEANGLSASTPLVAGQQLRMPDQLPSAYNNASQFRPYDPASAMGDLSPTAAPKPPKKSSCGTFAAILVAIVAVAVTIVATAGAASALSGGSFGKILGAMTGGLTATGAGGATITAGTWIAAGVAGGAVGSLASQGVGIATGMQEKINWGGVAMAGLAGGISGGLSAWGASAKATQAAITAGEKAAGSLGTLGKIGLFLSKAGAVSGAARAITSSVATQGIASLFGHKFDFAGVAYAGLGGLISGEVGGWLGEPASPGEVIGKTFVTSAAAGISNAAARSVITGTSFGDNMLAALPDVIGQTVGSLVAEGVSATAAKIERARQEARVKSQLSEVFQDTSLSAGQRADPRFSQFIRMELAAGKSVNEIKRTLANPVQIARIERMEYVNIPGTETHALAIPASDYAGSEEILDTALSYDISGQRKFRRYVSSRDFESFKGSEYSKSTSDKLNSAIDASTGEEYYYFDGYLIVGGSQGDRIDVARDLFRIAKTFRGRQFFSKSLETPTQERIIIDNNYDDWASAYVDYGAIRINLRTSEQLPLKTKSGWQKGPGQVVAIIAHEMGHIYSRMGDNHIGNGRGPEKHLMSNVMMNENPVRRELGLSERNNYYYYKIDTIRRGEYLTNGGYLSNSRIGPIPSIKTIFRP